MKELILLLFIGTSLSIDAFSIATCMGMTNIPQNKIIKASLTVGLFHFIMPLLGVIISSFIINKLNINTNLILGIILTLISLQMFIEYIKPSNKDIKLTNLGIILFAFGVSLDSFSVGLGLLAITNNLLLSSTIFSICSFSFTFLGLTVGKYINNKLNKYSYLIGTIILFILGISFICKTFVN